MIFAVTINLTWSSFWVLPALVLIVIVLIGIGILIRAIKKARQPPPPADTEKAKENPLTMKRVLVGALLGVPLMTALIAAAYACLERA